jgi:DNA-binding GntR family transcriptional regulator
MICTVSRPGHNKVATHEDRSGGIPRKVADQIREQITRGALPPGLQLRQMELAERFQSSRVPIREALKLLSAEGVVTHDPNRGFFVATLSSEEARWLYRIRHLLERELLSTVEWPDKAQLKALNDKVDEMEDLFKKGKRPEWMLCHREFHQAIFDLSPHKVLVREVLRVLRLTDRYRSLAPLPADRSMTPERHLVKALAARDRQKLIRVFDEDRTQLEELMLASLQARGL